jgi:membrane protein DedA with SNARE-associated domain
MVHASLWMSSVHELLKAYGLWALFLGITLQCSGIPLPGETMLVSAALYTGSTHRLGIGSVMLVAATAATAGGMIGYETGRCIGLRVLMHYGKYVRLDERRLKVGQYLFLRHGGKIVFFGRFVDPLRIFAAVLAGTNRMSRPYFLLMNAFGGICWVLLIGGGAYLFGEQMKRAAGRSTSYWSSWRSVWRSVVSSFFAIMRRNWSSARSVPFPGLSWTRQYLHAMSLTADLPRSRSPCCSRSRQDRRSCRAPG